MATKKKKNLKLIDIDPTFIPQCIEFFANGLSLSMIARAFGISKNELLTCMREDPDLMAAIHKQRVINISNVAHNLYEKAMSEDTRNNNCLMYYLDKVGHFSANWSEESGLEEPIPEANLKITTTDPIEAMREYERIMTRQEKKDNS